MRALCGAIITAAALIGMGLTAQAIGHRYSWEPTYPSDAERQGKDTDKGDGKAPIAKAPRVKFGDMDRPLTFTLVYLTCASLVGLGITFLGLAYHHARRERELALERERLSSVQRTTV